MSTQLKIDQLEVSFPQLFKTIKAVRGVSLELAPGEILGLVGESGSGKSMTAMAAMGLLPGNAELSGSIQWQDDKWLASEVSTLGQHIRGKRGAMIFQNPLTALNPYFPVGRQIYDVARQHRSLSKQELQQEIRSCLAQVHLPDPDRMILKYPHELSGGQIQRVVIAMALVCQPQVLIADEPTTALDVTVQAQILGLIQELAESRKLSVLLITHDLSVVATICDRVAVMYAGQIVEQGTVQQVIKDAIHPYSQKLLATVPEIGDTTVLEHIPGQVPDLGSDIIGCAFKDRCEHATEQCLQQPETTHAEGDHMFNCFRPWLQDVKQESMA